MGKRRWKKENGKIGGKRKESGRGKGGRKGKKRREKTGRKRKRENYEEPIGMRKKRAGRRMERKRTWKK